jgi:hemoglobin
MTIVVHPAVSGRASVPSHAPTVEISLYYVIGGRPAVVAAVDKFFARLLDDPVLGPFFPTGVDLKHRGFVITFLAQALGGPERYHGPDLGRAHGHLGITDAHFDRTAGHLDAALEELGLPRDLVDRIIGIVAGLRPTLVTA